MIKPFPIVWDERCMLVLVFMVMHEEFYNTIRPLPDLSWPIQWLWKMCPTGFTRLKIKKDQHLLIYLFYTFDCFLGCFFFVRVTNMFTFILLSNGWFSTLWSTGWTLVEWTPGFCSKPLFCLCNDGNVVLGSCTMWLTAQTCFSESLLGVNYFTLRAFFFIDLTIADHLFGIWMEF